MIIVIRNTICQISYTEQDEGLGCDIHKELRKYLRVRKPGYNWSPAFQSGRWDGYQYFYTNGRKFRTGLLPMVLKFVDALGVPDVQLIDQRKNPVKFRSELITKHKSYDISSGVYQYQGQIIEKTNRNLLFRGAQIPFYRGVWDSAVNSGKTIMAAFLCLNIEHGKMLFLVKERDLFIQTYRFFCEFFGKSQVGVIKPAFSASAGADLTKAAHSVGKVTIALVNTLKNRLNGKQSDYYRKTLEEVNILVVDECHEAINKTYQKVESMLDCYVRVYVSGSAYDGKDKAVLTTLYGMAGPRIHTVKTAELIEKGISRTPTVYLTEFKHPQSEVSFGWPGSRQKFILESIDRANLVCEIIERCVAKGERVVIAFYEIAHGELMLNTLKRRGRIGKATIDLVHGGDPDRDAKVARFLEKQIQVFFSSVILRKGINMPFVDSVIYTMGGKSVSSLKQWVGRILRMNKASKQVSVYDFIDVGDYVSRHSRARVRYYKEEGFEIKNIKNSDQKICILKNK